MSLTVTSFEDCVSSPNKSLAGIKKELGELGEATVLALLNILIVNLSRFLNVGKQISRDQAILTSKMILSSYPMLKPDDFKLCFDRIKAGRYGQIYDRMDGNVILEKISMYYDERCQYFEGKSVYEHKAQQKEEQSAPMPDNVKDIIKQLNEKKHKKTEIKRHDQTADQKLFNGFIDQFDKLHRNRPAKVKGGRFIKRYGRTMNVAEYLDYKAEQLIRVTKRLNRKVKKAA